MKKGFALLLVLLIAVVCCACGDGGEKSSATEVTENVTDSKEMMTIILVPQADDGKAIDDTQLDIATNIIETRLASVELKDFYVNPDKSTQQIALTYPKDEDEYLPDYLLTQVGDFRIYDPDGKKVMDGEDIASATPNVDMSQGEKDVEYVIVTQYTDQGAEKLKTLTKNNIGREISFYLDDELICSPKIEAPITDGMAQLNGDFSAEEASRIAGLINASPLPFPMKIINRPDGVKAI